MTNRRVAYHDVLAPRIRSWYLARLQKTVLGVISLEQSLDLYYALFGYDRTVEPKLDQLDKTGMSPDYVYRETKRSVASAEGKKAVGRAMREVANRDRKGAVP